MKKKLPISLLLVLLASIFLLLDILGYAISPAIQQSSLDNIEKPIAGFHYSVLPTEEIKKLLDTPVQELPETHEYLEYANNLVFLSIRHYNERRISIFENWVLWIAGRFYEPFSLTENTNRLVAGNAANCSEVSQILKSLLERVGFLVRFIELSGHVVLEVKTKAGWEVADPDYGVTYPVNLEFLEREKGIALMENTLRKKGYKEKKINGYVSAFQTSEDNSVLQIGSPLSPRKYLVETISEWLKWLFPVFLLLIGIVRFKFPKTSGPVEVLKAPNP